MALTSTVSTITCDHCGGACSREKESVSVQHKSIIRIVLGECGSEQYFKRGVFCSAECFKKAFDNPDSWFRPSGTPQTGDF